MMPSSRCAIANQSAEALKKNLGYAVDWNDYGMGHEVCWEEIGDISAWLQQVLAVSGT